MPEGGKPGPSTHDRWVCSASGCAISIDPAIALRCASALFEPADDSMLHRGEAGSYMNIHIQLPVRADADPPGGTVGMQSGTRNGKFGEHETKAIGLVTEPVGADDHGTPASAAVAIDGVTESLDHTGLFRIEVPGQDPAQVPLDCLARVCGSA